jgi:hypothetical protein
MALCNDAGQGLFPDLFAAEDVVFAASDTLLSKWRTGEHDASTVLLAESAYATYALGAMQDARDNVVGVDGRTITAVPAKYSMHQNYPNPFNPTTTIGYKLPQRVHVSLRVFNLLGQEVTVLVDEVQSAGYKSVDFSGSGLPSGVYLYRLTAGDFVATKKLVLLK